MGRVPLTPWTQLRYMRPHPAKHRRCGDRHLSIINTSGSDLDLPILCRFFPTPFKKRFSNAIIAKMLERLLAGGAEIQRQFGPQ